MLRADAFAKSGARHRHDVWSGDKLQLLEDVGFRPPVAHIRVRDPHGKFGVLRTSKRDSNEAILIGIRKWAKKNSVNECKDRCRRPDSDG